MQIPTLIDMIQEERGNLEVPEIRVWCHPHKIGEKGDDYFETFESFEKALKFIKGTPKAEDTPLIAFRGYEINIFEITEHKVKDT